MILSFPEHICTSFFLFPKDVSFLPESLILSSTYHLQVSMVSVLVSATMKKERKVHSSSEAQNKTDKIQEVLRAFQNQTSRMVIYNNFLNVTCKRNCKSFQMLWSPCFKIQNQKTNQNENPLSPIALESFIIAARKLSVRSICITLKIGSFL